MNDASVINIAETNPVEAITSVVPPSIYKGKLEPLIKSAKQEVKTKEKSKGKAATISSALIQALKSEDQANLDWALNQDVFFSHINDCLKRIMKLYKTQ